MAQSFRFGTVGAPITTPKKPGGSVGAILHTRSLGLGAFELGWVQSVRVKVETCAAIREAAIESDILLSVHAPYFFNLNATDEEWPKSRQRLMDAAHYGSLAGATEIIFHPGSYFEMPAAEVLKVAIPRLADCVRELRAAGNPVTLRPETMGKSAMLGSLDDTLAMSLAIEGVQPCVDFAHLHARPGDGTMNTYEEWARALEGLGKPHGGRWLREMSCHLSGIEYGPKGEKNHLPLAESDLDLDAIFRALKDFGCAGRILIESPAMEEDALLAQRKWAEIAGEQD